MPEKNQSIATAADRLYNLVEENKEISFKEAAAKLGVPVRAVEDWATFLEEDKLLAITYKLTTPYLTLPVAKEKKKTDEAKILTDSKPFAFNLKQAETKGNFKKIQKLMKVASDKILRGQFDSSGRIEYHAFQTLKEAVDAISQNKHTSPQKKAELSEELNEIEKKIRKATKLIEQRKFDQAEKEYSDSHARMKNLLSKTHKEFKEQEEIRIDDTYIKELLRKTYELLDEGKAEEASEAYEKALKIFSELSARFKTEKSELQEGLIKLNRDLAIRTDEIRVQQLKKNSALILELIKRTNESIKKKEFDMAARYYVEITNIFNSLPQGFSKEKREIKRKIIRIFEKIMKQREAKMKARFTLISKQIKEIIRNSEKKNRLADPNLDVKNYAKIKELFLQLPQGFMKEKLEIHTNLIMFYNRLTQNIESAAESSVNRGTFYIMQLLRLMKRQIEENSLDEAAKSYSRINIIFSKLPKGFIERKTDLQERIIGIYDEFLEKKDNSKKSAFYMTARDVEKMIRDAEAVVGYGDYPKAYVAYIRLKRAYIMLEPLKTNRRQFIRDKILLVYKKIIALRNRQEENSMSLPQLAHADRRTTVNTMIDNLKSQTRATVRMPSQ